MHPSSSAIEPAQSGLGTIRQARRHTCHTRLSQQISVSAWGSTQLPTMCWKCAASITATWAVAHLRKALPFGLDSRGDSATGSIALRDGALQLHMTGQEKVEGTIITASRSGQHVTRNVSWFRRVAPTESGTDTLPQEEDEEDGGGEGSQLNCSGEDQSEAQGCGMHKNERPGRRELIKDPTNGPTERNKRYNLCPNPTPSQWLQDFLC
ncbi:hypothetical protein NDU88_006097 [Pleurodeles waltl]|uniref:Uncharacterized protein n=1 Tax=Pleurodeles waltl TaxID=8319 RepID=A0AAV7LRF7_PLEWA|nr:hypothetical protein NDU88_006097 [Pleurodeles waltl]